MIRIEKPVAPAVLIDKGRIAARDLCSSFDASPAAYRSGVKTFEFDRTLYAAAAVKEALRDCQSWKCAFCESHYHHIAYGDVEHLRPKASYKQRDADALKRPGYYWLAYDWTNLFGACQLCNQQFKRNLFPLRDGRRRARTHRHSIANEEPLLIDPSAKDPADYIGFREEYAYAIDECAEGACTIEVLGLNREALVEQRRDRLENLKALTLLRQLLEARIAEEPSREMVDRLNAVEAILAESIAPSGEYSAMARCYLKQ